MTDNGGTRISSSASRSGEAYEPLGTSAYPIAIPRLSDGRGNLSYVEGGRHVPFDVARIYYLYDVPEDQARGAHAHRELQQLVIACAGSFELVVSDGHEKRVFRLDRPDVGIYIGSLVWRELRAFSAGAVCLVLASMRYDEIDYIRDYDLFLQIAGVS